MKYTSKVRTFTATLITMISLVRGADAAIIITFQEIGSDVHVTTTGSLNMSGLMNPSLPSNGTGVLLQNNAVYSFSGASQNFYTEANPIYGITGASFNTPQTFGSGNYPVIAVGNESFGFFESGGSGGFYVTAGYSGGSITSSLNIIQDTNFEDLGIEVGLISVAVFTTASGGDTMSAVAVPEPSSALLLGLGAMGLMGMRRRRTN